MLGVERAVGGQFRWPSGLLGRIVAGMMRRFNAPLNLWIVELLQEAAPDRTWRWASDPGWR
jgi:hypothetical protein